MADVATDIDREEIVKGYDPVIMRRLLGYLKPYAGAVVFAVLALLIATAAELFVPVVLKRSVDSYITVSWFRVSEENADDPALAEAMGDERSIDLDGYLYIREDVLKNLTAVEKEGLEQRGILTGERFYIARDGDPEAFPIEELEDMPKEERREIRRADFDGLNRMSLVMGGLLLASLVFSFLQIYLMAYAGQGVMKSLRMHLFGHVLGQSLSFINRNPLGKLVNRVTNDVETVNELFTTVLISLLKDVAVIVGVFVTLIALDTRLGLISLGALPVVAGITVIFRSRARDAYRKVRLHTSRVTAFLSEHISGMSIVQIFVREKRTAEEFKRRNDDLLDANLMEMRVFAVFRPVIDLLQSTAVALIIYAGARFLLRQELSLGILIAFINLIRQFFRPVMDISEKYTILQSAMAGSERVFSLLDEEERVPDTGTKDLPSTTEGLVEFRNVNFSYKEGEPVIRDLSFTVRPGETVAIVGYTGAGKTTIANLLSRLWDIGSGSIRLDGTDIREIPLGVLRETVQPVPQDVFILNDTVRENITLGLELPERDLIEVASHVQADRFIRVMSEGYDTRLTERGGNISTGQRQLISFARVLAHDPKVIILDEATSSIDTETEQLIQNAIGELMRGRTSLVIAHRLSTIKHADRILVLHKGRLVEEGNHEELLAENGMYAKLYSLQFG
jgi:ATP-binding cassette subfamily B protein